MDAGASLSTPCYTLMTTGKLCDGGKTARRLPPRTAQGGVRRETEVGSGCLADGGGDTLGATAHLRTVAAFDHDADQRLGTGGPQ
jgi:hypothetical protein